MSGFSKMSSRIACSFKVVVKQVESITVVTPSAALCSTCVSRIGFQLRVAVSVIDCVAYGTCWGSSTHRQLAAATEREGEDRNSIWQHLLCGLRLLVCI
mmetsp:Transcript_4054/g.8689  ORF Transcript_4054/g.8689 Transcript_4054/m.8689 type:complete len:99 (-) Transcript_4054:3027-3323(-)